MGVRPAVVVGHSSEEMAAAYAAGIVSASEAVVLAYYWGLAACDARADGAMLAVGLGAEAVAPYLAGRRGAAGAARARPPARRATCRSTPGRSWCRR